MNEIKGLLISLGDKKYKEFNEKLTPDTERPMLGIKIPKLREIAKGLLKEKEWKDILKNIDDEYFEEMILQGFVIGYAKCDIDEKIPFIEKFVSKIDSWGICDSFVPSLKIKEKDLDKILKWLMPYFKSNKEFEVRFGVIMLLDYYINEKYVDNVIQILDNIKHEGYYVKMGVAWCFAEIGTKFNEKLMDYLNNETNLDKFTYNKTLQKMIESYRIKEEQKEILRSMKKK